MDVIKWNYHLTLELLEFPSMKSVFPLLRSTEFLTHDVFRLSDGLIKRFWFCFFLQTGSVDQYNLGLKSCIWAI